MSKTKVVFAILFILGVSLLNVAVLIEASNHENQLAVDSFEQQPMPMSKSYHSDKDCNSSSKVCDIPNGSGCTQDDTGC